MHEPFILVDQAYLEINKWKQINNKLRVGFTTRRDGVSKKPFDSLNLGLHVADEKQSVIKNRIILAKKLGIPLSDWASGEQTHGTNIKIINKQDRGKGAKSIKSSIENTDGLITNANGILCTAFFADCVPLFFYDPIIDYVGLAHAGWRGTVNKIAKSMIDNFFDLGSVKEDILVGIGPSISIEKYEVNEMVIQNINDDLLEKVAVPLKNDRYMLDLKQLNVEILLQTGILRNNIDVTSYCSYINSDLFFSHRRDDGKTGRMLGFIGKLE